MWKKVFAKKGRSFGWYHGGEDSGGGGGGQMFGWGVLTLDGTM